MNTRLKILLVGLIICAGIVLIAANGCPLLTKTSKDSSSAGSSFDIGVGTWSSMADSGVFSGRDSHTAIWTGSEMIIWGGSQGGTPLNDGAIYNPSINSWTSSITMTDAPCGRGQYASVWTGSEMLIWGGAYNSNSQTVYPNIGARYNPALDKWTTMTI